MIFIVFRKCSIKCHAPERHFGGMNCADYIEDIGNFMVTGYISKLVGPEKKRYIDKVELISRKKFSNDLDPYEMKDWIDDVSLWPSIEFGSIYAYLIDMPGEFTKEKLKAYKSLDA